MSSGIEIRRIREDDQGEVIDLVNQIMNQEFGDDASAYPTDDIETISESYGALGEAFFVAIDGDEIVGTVGVKKEEERTALLRRLFVATPYRRRKIGLELVQAALNFCHEVGYDEVIFKTTSRMDKAITLCEKCGFTQRAKLNIGPVELMKFALSLRNGVPT